MIILEEFVQDFAKAMQRIDNRRPTAKSRRSERVYKPGIGPFAEDDAVELTIRELELLFPHKYRPRIHVPYPDSRQKCDLCLGSPSEWAIEVKMARMRGDNGKPDDMCTKDILSPFAADRSAIGDCQKLLNSNLAKQMAILIYGFEDTTRPLDVLIGTFELMANSHVHLGRRCTGRMDSLVHPVFASGRVFAWEIQS